MWIVGRDSRADIHIDLPQLSALHALVERTANGGFRVLDLGSTNGTFINGHRVKDGIAAPGVNLRFGSVPFDWNRYGSMLSGTPSGSSVTIGRHPSNDCVIDDGRVSSSHAVVLHRNGTALLVDLGSSNGVFVNGRRVFAEAVGANDQVRLGSLEVDLRWIWGSAPEMVADAPPEVGPEIAKPTDEGALEPPPPKKRGSRLRWVAGIAALALVATGAALFFTGTIWPYWYRAYEDPWPAAVEAASTAVDDHPTIRTKLQDSVSAGNSIEEQMAFLERARPILTQIDAWRELKLTGDLGMTMSWVKGFSGADLPDNAYDAVLMVMEEAAPGAGETVHELETVVRDILEMKDNLGSAEGVLRSTDLAAFNFQNRRDKNSLLELEQRVDDLRRQYDRTAPDLRSLSKRAAAASAGIEAVGGALYGAGQTSIGRYIQPQLNTLQSFLYASAEPIREFDRHSDRILENVSATLEILESVCANAEAARQSDELQRKRHARGIPGA